jgi:bacterioferritin
MVSGARPAGRDRRGPDLNNVTETAKMRLSYRLLSANRFRKARLTPSQERSVPMKGNEELIKTLNALLADELSAINQYMVHSEMSDSWGYGKLHAHFEKRSIDEMKHAEKLIGRILFLEGLPIVSELKNIHIGSDIPKQLISDHAAEEDAIRAYNAAIKLAGDVNDYATREILEKILGDEDRHIDEIEELQDQVAQMTLPLFLTTQLV